jgi:hypothetical protein
LFPADPVVGEVDRFGWPGVGLRRGELAKSTVRPGGVVMPQVLGQHPAQMVLINDQEPVEELTTQGADDPFVDRVRPGRLRRAGQDPDSFAVNTASKEPVKWPARSLIRNLTEAARRPRSIRKVRAPWIVQAPSGFAVMSAR